MTGNALKILPIFVIFALGMLLRRTRICDEHDADGLLRIVFYVALPALLFPVVASSPFSAVNMKLAIIAVLMVMAYLVVGYFAGSLLHLQARSLGAFLSGVAIMNTSFSLPFVLAIHGEEGLARMALFDLGNALVTFTAVFAIAIAFGSAKFNFKVASKRLFGSPPIWAIVLGLVANVTKIDVGFTEPFLRPLGAVAIPLLILALGVYFKLTARPTLIAVSGAALRVGGGFLVALAIIWLFDLQGLEKSVVLIGAVTPAGFNTLTFSAIGNLDRQLAAEIVSFSLLLSLIALPLVILLT